jgi:GT2 family glycosyltransferase
VSPIRAAVLVPVQAPAPGLDACLASLDRSLADGAPVLVVDDGCSDPRASALAEGWCARTRLGARYLRRERPWGLPATVAAAFDDFAEGDVVLLRHDAEATSGWLPRLQRAAEAQPRVACVSAWSGENELAAFADPAPPETIAEAAASLDWPAPAASLPAAAGPALYLRREALRALGGLDTTSFMGWGALDDFCRRAEALGWGNLLCPSAYVARGAQADGGATFGEIERLQVRWPDFQERVARFILEDPLRPLRERLRERIMELSRGGPQGDLFGH